MASAAGAHRSLDAFNATHARRKLPYYAVLNVSEAASQSEIVRAYRRLSLRLHPDKPGGSDEKFQELSAAYHCLRDEDRRRKYDDCGFDEDNLGSDEVDQFVDAFFGEGARGIDGRSPDWRMGAIECYVRINLAEVPLHMRDIVRIGLNYVVSLDHDFEDVLLMQHARVDIFYLIVGLFNEGELTQEVFESEDSYCITYYDNPLQPGIKPTWSDQNVLGPKKAKKKLKELPRKELNFEEFQRRQKIALAMLENGPPDPMVALEEKYRTKMLATEHERRTQAICGQDIYEEDAELDCNAYADHLENGKQQQLRGGSNGSAEGKPSEGNSVGDGTSAAGADAATGETALRKFQSQGAESVLGLSSDGVIFVARGGKVLRNEGPPRPNPSDQGLQQARWSSLFPFSFQACSCLQFSFLFGGRRP